ncbi:2,5-diamino-6-(ribosylamino)-4(3H)-pyrimidinone 5'-phosphate reductase [Halapricum hydrolyticum]|uniref:2,5-diamino-6-(ribosylamino)-4(3H)-pyrimidinone 5'-phosphate reductase n=1 Tax=Halapricum hydrolyticum TaxID=2979991 RepID=A0AAE3IB24_9EURY|nr:2,5-diamino-6-(ribosylamino)-4(3H)-pyrimidinone 5'-phosphate reductase [Halapricum hydrolyticum]MCU4718309.1 2,5-diamino-6-(ribosylamino)-4(3H)-pyrimidinone 5'-phosphate reductase [Halapricum hydrolyticum]MCU4727243.1 2,5-diamino-6-(ribosylamino)-4(3H)-pyrimidinone 5'-phosphate reductase [Halapricum hydrolyticum]
MQVIVNAATSVDGKLSTRRREQVAISGPADFDRVDALRADSDAVMVGVGTVLADDPSLTVDDPERIDARTGRGDPPQPARVIVDSRLRTPTDATVYDDAAETVFLVSEAATDEAVADARTRDAVVISAGDDRVDLSAALDRLETHGIEQLMVEGGGELVFSLFDAGLVDELSVFVGSMVIGGRDAPTLADGDGFVETFPDLRLGDVERIDDGVLLRYTVV